MIAKIRTILQMLKNLNKYFYYSLYCKIKKIENPSIWLISERGDDARDNGLHFYKYLKENHPEINIKYVIASNSPDRNKIYKKDIVDYGSKEHYILFKTAGVLLSTHVMGYSPDKSLFCRLDERNLLKLKGKRVYLRHGIMYSKQSDDGKIKVDIMATVAPKEYEFVKESYEFGPDVVKCIGFTRYDALLDQSSKEHEKILIMPTFRKWLNYTNNFEESDYFIKWNELLNDEKFIDFIEKNKIEAYFYPHYRIQKRLASFNSKSKNVKICAFKDYDVQDLLMESNLLITDYSSVQFDFAYMGKPVIYYQFDEDEFYAKHYSKGYFDFRKMGFGPVCVERDEVVDSLSLGENTIFQNRADAFFKYRDKNNSERTYFEIIKKIEGQK